MIDNQNINDQQQVAIKDGSINQVKPKGRLVLRRPKVDQGDVNSSHVPPIELAQDLPTQASLLKSTKVELKPKETSDTSSYLSGSYTSNNSNISKMERPHKIDHSKKTSLDEPISYNRAFIENKKAPIDTSVRTNKGIVESSGRSNPGFITPRGNTNEFPVAKKSNDFPIAKKSENTFASKNDALAMLVNESLHAKSFVKNKNENVAHEQSDHSPEIVSVVKPKVLDVVEIPVVSKLSNSPDRTQSKFSSNSFRGTSTTDTYRDNFNRDHSNKFKSDSFFKKEDSFSKFGINKNLKQATSSNVIQNTPAQEREILDKSIAKLDQLNNDIYLKTAIHERKPVEKPVAEKQSVEIDHSDNKTGSGFPNQKSTSQQIYTMPYENKKYGPYQKPDYQNQRPDYQKPRYGSDNTRSPENGSRPNYQRPYNSAGYGVGDNTRSPENGPRPNYQRPYNPTGYGASDNKPINERVGFDRNADTNRSSYGQDLNSNRFTTRNNQQGGTFNREAYNSQDRSSGFRSDHNAERPGYNAERPSYNNSQDRSSGFRSDHNAERPGYNAERPGYNAERPGYNNSFNRRPGFNNDQRGTGSRPNDYRSSRFGQANNSTGNYGFNSSNQNSFSRPDSDRNQPWQQGQSRTGNSNFGQNVYQSSWSQRNNQSQAGLRTTHSSNSPYSTENKKRNTEADFGAPRDIEAEKEFNKPQQYRNKNKSHKHKEFDDSTHLKPKKTLHARMSLHDDSEDEVHVRVKRRAKKSSYQNSHKPMVLTLGTSITLIELAKIINQKVKNLILEFVKFGFKFNENSYIDYDTAKLILEDLGHEVQKMENKIVDNVLNNTSGNTSEKYITKPPVVVIMGHVDHGKTSLLDSIRSSDIAQKEHGNITQHIGAYAIDFQDKKITFLDTPGHEAFAQIRSRGSNVADLAILVVAADDGIKPQTIEAISHIKAANIPMIIAVNKIDKQPNYQKIINDLLQYDVLTEENGGDVMVVPVSALKKTNLDKLCEAILLQAEMLNIKYLENTRPFGTIIESRIDKNQGIVISILIQADRVKVGDIIVSDDAYGKIRIMTNDRGEKVKEACVSTPVEIFGINKIPGIGSKFLIVSSEKEAKELANNFEKNKTPLEEKDIDVLARLKIGKIFNLIIKADVSSSLEAIKSSVLKIKNEEIDVKIVYGGIGPVTDTDVLLAKTTGSSIVAFNIKTPTNVLNNAEKSDIKVISHSLIYSLIDDVTNIVTGMLDDIVTEEIIGEAAIREVFMLSKFGIVAGCYITKGKVKRNHKARVIRDNKVIANTKIESIKRFKEDVAEAAENFECGILMRFKDFRLGDVIECIEETITKGKL